MVKENVKDIEIVDVISEGEYSKVFRLKDGRIAKFVSPYVLSLYYRMGHSLEKKVMEAENIIMSEIAKPVSILYNQGKFCGTTMKENKGISMNQYDATLSLKQRGDLYGYANRHMQLENIVKKGHMENKTIVFPDLCTFDNVFIDKKGNLSLIDYEGLQVGEHLSVNMSTNLGDQEKYTSLKYLKGDLFTPEIDITGLIIMYFLAAFNVDLKVVGQINPVTGKIITVKDVFEIMELQDEVELMKIVELALSNKEKGVYLGNKMFELAEKYNMEAYATNVSGLYLKKLIRK